MNTKQFSLIPIENGFVVAEKKEDTSIQKYIIYPSGRYEWGYDIGLNYGRSQNGKDAFEIIAHTGIPSLIDSGLPLVEMPDACTQAFRKIFPIFEEKNSILEEGFQYGYKAAGGYTEEDMYVMFQSGREFELNRDERDSLIGAEEVLESLKPKPKYICLVMENDVPLVEKGYVKVKSIEY